jgi:spore maturation protein CgeB
MRVLILNTDYPNFLERLYAQSPGLEERPYGEQMEARNASLFGVFDSYSRHLRAAGFEAWEVHANNEAMQKRWAKEQGLDFGKLGDDYGTLRQALSSLPRIGRRFRRRLPTEPWFQGILARQIAHYRPDVILNQDVYMISGRFLAEAMGGRGLVAGQIAAPLPATEDWSGYGLMISSLPNLVRHFQSLGLKAEFCPLGFDPAVLDHIQAPAQRDIPLLFVGSFSGQHRTRIELLEYLCRHIGLEIWGSGLAALDRASPIRSCLRGEAWGADMYRLLARSQIVLNQHIDMAGEFANNCRLFEATGMGALLLTDRKSNLAEYFIPGVEAADYASPEECLNLIRHFQANPDEARRLAEAGRRRTLSSHSYADRMVDLAALFQHHLAMPGSAS